MNREILFRVWDTKFNCYINIFSGKTGAMLHDTGIAISTGYDVEDNPIWDWKKVEFDRYIFEQFTGLLDKNGKRIFEGDIIKWVGSTHSVRGIEFSNQVYWLKYRWRVKGTHNNKTFHTNLSSSQVYNHEIEVIGNIHDKTEQP